MRDVQLERVRVRRVFANGRHNAFTSLARWRGRLYLAFRTADDHANPDAPEGVITVLVSDDGGASWSHLATVTGMYGMDLRDPKLLATPDRLYLHTFEYQGRSRRDAMVSWTDDGERFVPVRRAVAEENHVVWWPVYHKGRYWASGYRYSGDKWGIRTVLFSSADGVNWRVVSRVSDVPWSNEAVLIMEEDDSATVLVRNDGDRLSPPASSGRPVFARALPPYREWTYTELGRKLTGLAVLRVAGGYVIAARDHEQDELRTACFFCDERWLAQPAAATGPASGAAREAPLRRLFTLPSGGDTSYAGFVRDGHRVLMSYYSSHEHAASGGRRPASIYLAEFDLDEVLAVDPGAAQS